MMHNKLTDSSPFPIAETLYEGRAMCDVPLAYLRRFVEWMEQSPDMASEPDAARVLEYVMARTCVEARRKGE